MGEEVSLRISEEDADAERLAALSGYLRAELLQLDVEDVVPQRAGDAPPGARAVDITAAGALVVALGQSAEGLRSVVSAITGWLGRGEGTRRTVRLELGRDTLELSHASTADQDRLIDLFISQHATGNGRR
jgi:hypothetical protein